MRFDVKNETKLAWNWIMLKLKILEFCINLKGKTKFREIVPWNNRPMMVSFCTYFTSFLVEKLNSQWKYSIPQRYHSNYFHRIIIKNIPKQNFRFVKLKHIIFDGFYVDFINFIDKLLDDLMNTIDLCAFLLIEGGVWAGTMLGRDFGLLIV